MGETLEALSKNIDTYSYRQPLGVCAGICPFNFPAMIPLCKKIYNYFIIYLFFFTHLNSGMFPLAITTGNTYILKPSERDPGAAMIITRLVQEAGLPPGVLNVVHGARDTVNFICDDPNVRAISFVGKKKKQIILSM